MSIANDWKKLDTEYLEPMNISDKAAAGSWKSPFNALRR